VKEGLIGGWFEEIQKISLGVFDVSGIEGRILSFRIAASVDKMSGGGRGRGSGSRGLAEKGCRLGLRLGDTPAYLSWGVRFQTQA